MAIELSRRNKRTCLQLFMHFIDSLVDGSTGGFGFETRWGHLPEGTDPNSRYVSYTMYISEALIEQIGGATDGRRTFDGYQFGLTDFMTALGPTIGPHGGRPPWVNFITLVDGEATNDEEGDAGIPHLCINGSFQGRNFHIHIMAEPMAGAPVTARVHTNGKVEYLDEPDFGSDEE